MTTSPLHDLFEKDSVEQSPLHKLFLGQEPSNQEKPKERSTFEQYVQRPEQILTRGAAGFVRSAIPSIAEAAKGFENIIKSTNPRGKTKIPAPAITQKEERPKFKAPEWFKKVFPTYHEAQEEFQRSQPNLAIPENAFERGLEKVGQGIIPSLAGGAAAQLANIGSSAAQQVAEEYKLPIPLQILSAMGGELGARGGLALAQGRGLSSVYPFRQRPSQESTQYMQASREMGVDPLASGMNPSRNAQVAQELTTLSPGGYEAAQEAYAARSGQIANAFDETLAHLGNNILTDPNSAGTVLREGIQQATNQVERQKSALYRYVDETIPENEAIRVGRGTGINAPEVRNAINEVIPELELTMSQSAPESKAYQAAQRARDNIRRLNAPPDIQLLDQHGNPIPHQDSSHIGVRQLEQTQRSIRDAINFDRPGGPDKLLRRIDHEISRSLNEYGNTNPRYATARREANEFFRNEVVPIRSNVLNSIRTGEIPEYALSKMNTVGGVRFVRQALNHLPNGNELFNSLARYQVQRKIIEKVFDPNTGLIKTDALKNMLNKEDRHLFRELVGNEAYQRLEHLQHIGRGLDKGFKGIINPSQTSKHQHTLSQALFGPLQITSGIMAFLTGNPQLAAFLIANGTAAMTIPRIASRIIYSPEFARNIERAAEAGARGNRPAFIKYLTQAQADFDRLEEKENQRPVK